MLPCLGRTDSAVVLLSISRSFAKIEGYIWLYQHLWLSFFLVSFYLSSVPSDQIVLLGAVPAICAVPPSTLLSLGAAVQSGFAVSTIDLDFLSGYLMHARPTYCLHEGQSTSNTLSTGSSKRTLTSPVICLVFGSIAPLGATARGASGLTCAVSKVFAVIASNYPDPDALTASNLAAWHFASAVPFVISPTGGVGTPS